MGYTPPKVRITKPDSTVTTFRNLASYSVQEDVTPLDISDQSGGIGTASVSFAEPANATYLYRLPITLVDAAQGTTTGVTSSPTSDGHTLTLPAQSRLSALSVTRVAQPFIGTLAAAITYYLGLVNVTSAVVVDASLTSINVVLPGWKDMVWTRMRNLCSAYQIEIALVSNNVVVRPARQRIAKNRRDSNVSWALSDSKIAQTVEFFYYNNRQMTNELIYPLGGWTTGTQIINVDAGAIQELDVQLVPRSGDGGLGVSLTSVVQPTCVSSVGMYDSSASVYTVTDSAGAIVDPVAWANGGGSVQISINEDTQGINIAVTGAYNVPNAPFNIAMPLGTNDNYSSLRILGSGVAYNKTKATFSTGLSADSAPDVVSATLDTPFLSDWGHAFGAALWTLHVAQGASQSITVTSKGINRASDNGSYAYPLLSDWESHYASMTITAVDTAHSGMTLNDVEAQEYGWVSNSFANQAFGNIAGARVRHAGCWYRIRTATIAQDSINYSADWDTTLADWETQYAGLTIAQVDAKAAGLTLNNLNTKPLL